MQFTYGLTFLTCHSCFTQILINTYEGDMLRKLDTAFSSSHKSISKNKKHDEKLTMGSLREKGNLNFDSF